jgi:hypothetical protein
MLEKWFFKEGFVMRKIVSIAAALMLLVTLATLATSCTIPSGGGGGGGDLIGVAMPTKSLQRWKGFVVYIKHRPVYVSVLDNIAFINGSEEIKIILITLAVVLERFFEEIQYLRILSN